MKPAITKTKKFLAVIMCIFMLSSVAVPFAGAEDVAANNLEWLVADEQKTLTVPSTDTPNTFTLPEATLQSGEGEITYSLCSDAEGKNEFIMSNFAIKDSKQPIVTVENSFKDYVKRVGENKINVYVKATAKKEGTVIDSKVITLSVENYKVHVIFLGRNGEEKLGEGDVYYGASAAEIGDALKEKVTFPEPNQWRHYGFGNWYVYEGDNESTYDSVKGDVTFRPSVKSILHTFNNGTVKKAATCTEEGIIEYKCVGCTYSYTEAIKATHVFVNKNEGGDYEYSAPTCEGEGYEKGTCTVCHEYIDTKLSATGHDYIVKESSILPTCTEPGRTESKECKICHKVIESTVIEATGHQWKVVEAKEATCTEKGNTSGIICSVCKVYQTPVEEIPALDHDMKDYGYLAPTCTKKGHYPGKFCSRCGYTEAENAYIAALDHNIEVDLEAIEPTCTEKGRTRGAHCTRCDYKEVSEERVALGHDIEIDPASDATCTEPAKTEGSHCKRCNAVLKAQETSGEALGHDMIVYEVAIPATCKDHGKTAGRKCTRCDYKEEPVETALIDHEYEIVPGDDDIEPTCTEKGHRAARVCTVCEAELPGEELPALGHVDENDDNKCDVCDAEITHIDPSANCPHFCHSTNIFKKILWKIVRSLYKLLGIQKFCDCKVAHYN